MIEIKNPLDEPVWVYIECSNTLTIVPIGIAGSTTSKLNVAFFGGKCLIRDWHVWIEDKRPTGLRARGSGINRTSHP